MKTLMQEHLEAKHKECADLEKRIKELEKENEELKKHHEIYECRTEHRHGEELTRLRKENELLKEWNTAWKESHAILQKSLSEDKEVCEWTLTKTGTYISSCGNGYMHLSITCPKCGKPIKEV